ncbi:MAG: radical SAM family heme chaperone HemW [Planctomycetota bacterium]|nr:radical SAM family heme chaperone HemW [Planctomycetota bacterium]
MTQGTTISLLGQRRLSSARDIFGPPGSLAPPAAGAGGTLPAPHEPVRSLYIHVPFCFHKCHYCDFYSIVDTRDRQEAFLGRLLDELRAIAPLSHGAPLRTIFVGGGTPSLLRPVLWQRLLGALGELFDMTLLRPNARGGGEFTVECNPETVTPELMDVLFAGGVSRVSIGAQSFNERHLKTLERWHDPANVAKAIEMARDAGIARQSLDLIYAIPGQTLAEWEADLDRAIALGTEHASCYALTYEPQTAMTARMERGDFQPAPNDLEAQMFSRTVERLSQAGLHRYEVSNFARRDRDGSSAVCQHNLAYWRQEQWLAAGPAAAAHVRGHRWKNVPRLDDYLRFSDNGWPPITDHEPPDARRAFSERIMTGLRLEEGLDLSDTLARAASVSASLPPKLVDVAASLRARGLMGTNERWALTDEGFLVANSVILEFFERIDERE